MVIYGKVEGAESQVNTLLCGVSAKRVDHAILYIHREKLSVPFKVLLPTDTQNGGNFLPRKVNVLVPASAAGQVPPENTVEEKVQHPPGWVGYFQR